MIHWKVFLHRSLASLRHLRLEILDRANARLPSLEQTPRPHSVIIDAPQYRDMIISGCFGTYQSTADYECTTDRYRAFIKRACDSDDSGVVIPVPETPATRVVGVFWPLGQTRWLEVLGAGLQHEHR